MANDYVGVDPGLSGAWVLMSDGPGIIRCGPMPTVKSGPKGRRVVDVNGLSNVFGSMPGYPIHPTFVVEDIVGRPGVMSVQSAMSYGQGHGMILGVLAGLGIPRVLVRPQVWQSALGLASKGADVKARARAFIKARFPNWAPDGQGEVDAACLAFYGRISRA